MTKKETSLRQKESQLSKKEINLKKKETKLRQKESQLSKKEINLKKKETKLRQKESIEILNQSKLSI